MAEATTSSPQLTQHRVQWIVLMAAFLVSGVAGLIYESIWTHYLKLYLGHASYAQTLVLATFMGGLALGSWWASKLSLSSRDLLRGYAYVEIIIGILGLVFHGVFVAFERWSFESVIPALPGPTAIFAFKWLFALLLVTPQSVLLGMTFPLMVGGVLRRFGGGGGKAIASFYFVNSFGAAIGVWLSGFLLIAIAGLPGTLILAGALNLLVGIVSLTVAASMAPGEPSMPSSAPVEASALPLGLGRLLLLCAAGTGLASFIYEIAWIRMLNLVLGTTTHAFELMLGTFILGMALGALAIRRRIDHLASPVRVLGVVQVVMAVAAALTIVFYNSLFSGMEYLLAGLARTDTGYLLFNLVSLGFCVVVMLPATICAGMTLPLITHALRQQQGGEAVVGRVYAVNTLGAIIGVVLVSVVLIPTVGLKWALFVGILVDLALGLLLLASVSRASVLRPLPVATCLVILAIGVLVSFDAGRMASGVYFRSASIEDPRTQLVYAADGPTASIAVRRYHTGHFTILTNGKPDAGLQLYDKPASADESTMVLLGALPLAAKPDAKEVAVVGFGSGMTSHTLLLEEGLERVDTIEIEPRMVEGARAFAPRVQRVFDDPRSHIHIEDAKTWFSTSGRQYDIIVSEPSNPWVSGVAGLFSQEYYASLKRNLAPGGLLAQWIHIPEFNDSLLSAVLKALDTHYRFYALYQLSPADVAILASSQPLPPLSDALFSSPALRDDLARIGVRGLADFRVRLLADNRTLSPYLRALPGMANSDYFPVVDLGAVRARFLGETAGMVIDARRVINQLEPAALQAALSRVEPAELPLAPFQALESRAMVQRQGDAEQREASVAWANGGGYTAMLRLEALWRDCTLEPDLVAENAVLVAERVEQFPFGDRLAGFWQSLAAAPCAANAGERTRGLLRFLQATATLDDDEIIRAASSLLPVAGNAEKRYVLINLAGALLRQGDGERALKELQEAGLTRADTVLLMLATRAQAL